MSDLRARAASTLNGATGGRENWSKWDREVFDVVDEGTDEITSLRAQLGAMTHALSVAIGRADVLEKAMRDSCDLLAERTYGNGARSPGHNARLKLEATLTDENRKVDP